MGLTTSSTMLRPCLSLIVLVSSTCCSPVNFLGVPGYSQEVISPNIYPLRTALDVLQPGLGYGYGQYGYGYPWALNSFGFGSLIHPNSPGCCSCGRLCCCSQGCCGCSSGRD